MLHLIYFVNIWNLSSLTSTPYAKETCDTEPTPNLFDSTSAKIYRDYLPNSSA